LGRPLLSTDLDQFATIAASHISTHDDTCCHTARLALTSALDTGTVETSLAAVPAVVKWQAVPWPVTWCQLAGDDDAFIGDCGVHAALAALILQQHGVAFQRAQIAIAAGPYHVEHWRERWRRAGIPQTWIGQHTVYHEVLSIGSRFWDPSEARWFTGPGASLPSGWVAACRNHGSAWITTQGDNAPGATDPSQDAGGDVDH